MKRAIFSWGSGVLLGMLLLCCGGDSPECPPINEVGNGLDCSAFSEGMKCDGDSRDAIYTEGCTCLQGQWNCMTTPRYCDAETADGVSCSPALEGKACYLASLELCDCTNGAWDCP